MAAQSKEKHHHKLNTHKNKTIKSMGQTAKQIIMKLPIYSSANKLNKHIQDEDWEAVKARCDHNPREAGVWSKRIGFFDGEHDSRVLPLHQACALRAPKDVINALIVAYPKGVQAIETAFERLPIHIACQHGAKADVIELLLSYDPLCAHVEDKFGRFPVHYACSNGAPPDVIDAFLSADPSSVAYPDKGGWLPLHVACHMGVSTEAIRKLVEANPQSVNAKTAKGSTPLKLLSKISCKNEVEIANLLENVSVSRKRRNHHIDVSANIKERRIVSRAA